MKIIFTLIKNQGKQKIIQELEFWKLIEKEINILKIAIKFKRNWNFENYLRIGVLKIKFKNWSFED